MLANMGGRELYLKVIRDRDQRAINSAEFRKVLLAYKRLQAYVDPASPGRNWNDATALVIAAAPACRSWATGPRASSPPPARPGREYGCMPGPGPPTVPT
jgi:glucose/mannose transport system substrate-binding protein